MYRLLTLLEAFTNEPIMDHILNGSHVIISQIPIQQLPDKVGTQIDETGNVFSENIVKNAPNLVEFG